jgi:hypothetical protein
MGVHTTGRAAESQKGSHIPPQPEQSMRPVAPAAHQGVSQLHLSYSLTQP